MSFRLFKKKHFSFNSSLRNDLRLAFAWLRNGDVHALFPITRKIHEIRTITADAEVLSIFAKIIKHNF